MTRASKQSTAGAGSQAARASIGQVAPEAIAALLERHHLPAPRSVEPLGDKEGSTALLANGELVIYFDQGDPPVPKLAKEALIYRRLRRSTDVPCPEVLALDTTHELVPYDALILSYVDGVDGSSTWNTLDEEAREKLSEEVGRIFGTIHGLPWQAYGNYDPAIGTLGEFPRWTDMLLCRLEKVGAEALARGALPQPLIAAVLTEINDGDSVLETASLPTLVHGDLHAGNLLLKQQDGSWHVVAVLDWALALAADAAWEFAALAFRRSDDDPIGDAFLYGYRERHPIQPDLRSRIHLYRLMLHLEGAVIAQSQATQDRGAQHRHEVALRRLLIRQ